MYFFICKVKIESNDSVEKILRVIGHLLYRLYKICYITLP